MHGIEAYQSRASVHTISSSGMLLSPPTEHALRARYCAKCFTFASHFVLMMPSDRYHYFIPSFCGRGNQSWMVVSDRTRALRHCHLPHQKVSSLRAETRPRGSFVNWPLHLHLTFFLKVSERVNKDRYVGGRGGMYKYKEMKLGKGNKSRQEQWRQRDINTPKTMCKPFTKVYR